MYHWNNQSLIANANAARAAGRLLTNLLATISSRLVMDMVLRVALIALGLLLKRHQTQASRKELSNGNQSLFRLSGLRQPIQIPRRVG